MLNLKLKKERVIRWLRSTWPIAFRRFFISWMNGWILSLPLMEIKGEDFSWKQSKCAYFGLFLTDLSPVFFRWSVFDNGKRYLNNITRDFSNFCHHLHFEESKLWIPTKLWHFWYYKRTQKFREINVFKKAFAFTFFPWKFNLMNRLIWRKFQKNCKYCFWIL